MLTILKNKQNSFNDKPLSTNYIIEKNQKIQSNSEAIREGDELTITFAEAEIKALVKSKTTYNGREFDV